MFKEIYFTTCLIYQNMIQFFFSKFYKENNIIYKEIFPGTFVRIQSNILIFFKNVFYQQPKSQELSPYQMTLLYDVSLKVSFISNRTANSFPRSINKKTRSFIKSFIRNSYPHNKYQDSRLYSAQLFIVLLSGVDLFIYQISRFQVILFEVVDDTGKSFLL